MKQTLLFVLILCCLSSLPSQGLAQVTPKSNLNYTGYYTTFMRMQTMGLREWKQVIDCIHADGGNTFLLWMGGAFRSRKFPITWQYNKDHKNVQKDFVRALIDYAHTKQIRVLLCLTPFAYDGTNQYPREHPELKATQKNGEPAHYWGMHSWGYNLCPAKPESQRFMLEYAKELLFDFYPNADGMMIESSDYAICYCSQCKEHFFDNEFRFVKAISEEIWRVKTDATILVYPHYFNGRPVPGFDVSGAKQAFDPRWTLFFTPHSAHIDAELLKQAKTSIFWNEGLTLGTPQRVREGVQMTHKYGISGYVPSLEPMSCPSGSPENPGARVKPFHYAWLKEGQMPLKEILIRINRIAYREYTHNPELGEERFQEILGREIFGKGATKQAVRDLLALQETYNFEADWLFPSPFVSPERTQRERWSTERRDIFRTRVARLKEIALRYSTSKNRAERAMSSIAGDIVEKWKHLL